LKKVAIVGGGLAGLVSGILLATKGVPCMLFERKKFPFHKVCGEYVSNESLSFLKKSNLYPGEFEPSQITQFQLSSVRGRSATMPLDLGGFGISRFNFDNFLFDKARESGVELYDGVEVSDVQRFDELFRLETSAGTFDAEIVVGAFGKRSRIDVKMNRDFIDRRSPYVGVKYHVKSNHPSKVVALHNFNGGYCGVANVENNVTNICYLVRREVLQASGNISVLEKNTLSENPLLKDLLNNCDRLFDKPLVINEISFETKSPVEQNVLMAGDAAGMIAPLCGNGMAMAIHSAKILSELLVEYFTGTISKMELEERYSSQWRKLFARRLWWGRTVQGIFGNSQLSELGVGLILSSKPVARFVMSRTHGSVF
jgi:menaquinone-9 beta-reductase